MKITQTVVTSEQMNREINELCYNGAKLRKVKNKTVMWLGNVISLEYLPTKLNWSKVKTVLIKPNPHNPANDFEIIIYQ